MKKNYEWVVVVTWQGNPAYYPQKNLLYGMISLIYHFISKNKFDTANFALKQRFK